MKYFIVILLMLFLGHFTSDGRTYYLVEQECDNAFAQKDSVSRNRNSNNSFEEIRVLHENDGCLTNLKKIEVWKVKEYASRQEDKFQKMESDLLKQIPAQTLKAFLECKSNPIVCKLTITPREGIIREVAFQMNEKAASVFTDENILEFEHIILNTRFSPDESLNGDVAVYYWAISRKRIEQYLDTDR